MKKIILVFTVLCLCTCVKKNETLKKADFTSKSSPGDLTLAITASSVTADGKTYSEIIAAVSETVAAKNSVAVFEITPFGKFSSGLSTVTVALDVNGKAKVFASSATPGLASVKVTVGRFVATNTVVFSPTVTIYPQTFKIYAKTNGVVADDNSYCEIVVVSDSIKDKAISFTTDKGSFKNNAGTYSVQVSPSDSTRAFLKCNTPGLVLVTVSVPGLPSRELFVNFIPSLPDQILLLPSQIVAPPQYTTKIIMTAKLLRNVGILTAGQIVSFTDSSTSGSVGVFYNTTRSNTNGDATSEYWLQDTTFRGSVFLKATTEGSTGKIAKIAKILIKN